MPKPTSEEKAAIYQWAEEYLKPYYHPKLSVYERTKYMLFKFIWLPRFLLGLIPCFVWTTIMQIHVKLMPGGRLTFRQKSYMMWLEANLAKITLLCFGMVVRQRGEFAPRLKDGRWIPMVCNHQTPLDIMVLVTKKKISYVAKDDVAQAPVYGVGSINSDCVFVKRQCADSREEAKKQIKARIARDDTVSPLTIFPEGTTTNGKYLVPFKTSIFECGGPVQPIRLEYGHKHFRIGWTQIGLIENVKRMCSQFSNPVTIHVMPVYYPTAEELANPTLYADNVRKHMVEQSNGQLLMSEVKTRNSFNYMKALEGKMTLDELKAKYEESMAL